jgi:TRAP-type transport system periplasmic protein
MNQQSSSHKSFLVSGLALAASLLCAGAAQAQTVLTASSWIFPTHALSTAQKSWCDQLEANTKGKMKCNILPRGVTGGPGTYDAIKNGQADISFTVHGYTPGRFVATKMAEFPFLGNSSESLSVAFHKVASKYPAFEAEHPGVKVLAYFTHGPGIIFNTKRAITKPEDLSGLKFRVGGGMVNDVSQALGMNVTLKPANESFELLNGGVMDGTLFPAESIEGFKIDKLIKHATTFPGGLYNTSFVAFMNKAKYDSLTAEEKKAVDAISGENYARMFGRNWDNVDRRGHALMQANGTVITKADSKFVGDVKGKISALEAKWVAEAEAKGLKDAKKVLAEFRAEIAKQEK